MIMKKWSECALIDILRSFGSVTAKEYQSFIRASHKKSTTKITTIVTTTLDDNKEQTESESFCVQLL